MWDNPAGLVFTIENGRQIDQWRAEKNFRSLYPGPLRPLYRAYGPGQRRPDGTLYSGRSGTVKAIQHSSDDKAEYAAVNNYNSYVMGIHNYYGMATAANPDMQTLAYEIKISIKNRLQERVKRRTDQSIPQYAEQYAKSKEIRFIGQTILLATFSIIRPSTKRKLSISTSRKDEWKSIKIWRV